MSDLPFLSRLGYLGYLVATTRVGHIVNNWLRRTLAFLRSMFIGIRKSSTCGNSHLFEHCGSVSRSMVCRKKILLLKCELLQIKCIS